MTTENNLSLENLEKLTQALPSWGKKQKQKQKTHTQRKKQKHPTKTQLFQLM